jgi:hypothetical protein
LNRWRSSDVLGLAWLHGTLHASVFHRQLATKSWVSETPVHTLEEFEAALDVALRTLGFSGTEVFLVLEHDAFVHQAEYAPAFSESAARAYLRGRIERYEKEREPVLWISQRTVSARQEAAFLLHLLPSAFYGRLNGFLLARRLDLTRILPLVVPLQLVLDSGSTPKDQPVLVVAEAGDATTLMVSRANGELVFARTMLARWQTDSERIAVEVNRSLLYAKQQFGAVVEHIQLLGAVAEKPQGDVLAKCGSGKQLTVRATSVTDWLQAVARLSQRHPVNLVVGYLGRKRRQQFLRRALLAACWLGLGLMMLDAWSRIGTWEAENSRWQSLAANHEAMNAEVIRLEERNAVVTRQNEIVVQTVDGRLPPVPSRFLAYLGSVRPPEMQFTDFNVSWDAAADRWSFRLEGQIEGDEELAREGVAAFQRLLAKSPFRARFSDSVRSLTVVAGSGLGIPTAQRFALEGGLFED